MSKYAKPKKRPTGPPKPKCDHPVLEDVKSANGAITYRHRCIRCNRQWANEKCRKCGVGRTALANRERTSWTCRACQKAEAA